MKSIICFISCLLSSCLYAQPEIRYDSDLNSIIVSGARFVQAYSYEESSLLFEDIDGLTFVDFSATERPWNLNWRDRPGASYVSGISDGSDVTIRLGTGHSWSIVASDIGGLEESLDLPLWSRPDVNHDGWITADDFDEFLSNFSIGSEWADYDRDGFVEGEDLDEFIVGFEQGRGTGSDGSGYDDYLACVAMCKADYTAVYKSCLPYLPYPKHYYICLESAAWQREICLAGCDQLLGHSRWVNLWYAMRCMQFCKDKFAQDKLDCGNKYAPMTEEWKTCLRQAWDDYRSCRQMCGQR